MSFLAAGVSAGIGVTQAVVGGIEASKARKALQNLQTPVYQPNKAISDYYQTALNRYNTSPYQSNFYEQAQKASGRNLATGIGALTDRHSAGNVGALVQGSQDQLQKAGVQAEGLQRQDFGQLGQAANMQAADARTAFEYNQVAPYEKQFGIDQAKAIAGSQMENAGFQNISGGIGNYSQMNQYKQMFGGGGSSGGAGAMTNAFGGGSSAGTSNPGIGGGGLGSALGSIGTIGPWG